MYTLHRSVRVAVFALAAALTINLSASAAVAATRTYLTFGAVPNVIAPGQPLSLYSWTQGPNYVPAQGGTITFTGLGRVLCTRVVDARGSATCYVPQGASPAGEFTFTATYSGTATQDAAASSITISVRATATVSQISATPAPVGFLEQVTITARVVPAQPHPLVPTGSVGILVDRRPVVYLPLTSGQASVVLSAMALGLGEHTVMASYSGDANFMANTSTRYVFTVTPFCSGSGCGTPGSLV